MSRAILLSGNEQQLRNLVNNPKPSSTANFSVTYRGVSSNWAPWPGTNGAAINSIITTGFPASPNGVRQTWTTAPNSGLGDTGMSFTGLRPNTIYSFGVFIRSSRTFSNSTSVGNWVQGGVAGAGSGTVITKNSPTISPVWTRAYTTFKTGSATTGFKVYSGPAAGMTWAVNDTLDAAAPILVEGSTIPDYSDGDTSGFKWDGSAGVSSSVGYPYTLPRIAGNTSASYVTSNPQSNVSASPSPLLVYNAPRTALFMYEITGTTTNPAQYPIVRHGSTIAGQTRIRLMTSTTSGQLQIIVIAGNWDGTTGVDGVQSYANLPLSAGNVGKHIFALTWDGTISSAATLLWNSDGTEGSTSFDMGTGLYDGGSIYGYYNAGVANSGAGYILTDTRTVARIAAVKWLANKYGVQSN